MVQIKSISRCEVHGELETLYLLLDNHLHEPSASNNLHNSMVSQRFVMFWEEIDFC